MKTLHIKSGTTFLQVFISNAPAGFNGRVVAFFAAAWRRLTFE